MLLPASILDDDDLAWLQAKAVAKAKNLCLATWKGVQLAAKLLSKHTPPVVCLQVVLWLKILKIPRFDFEEVKATSFLDVQKILSYSNRMPIWWSPQS